MIFKSNPDRLKLIDDHKGLNMENRYPHQTKAAQLKRWQPLIHHKNADARFLTILLPILESTYQTLRQSIHAMTTLASRFSDARLANHLRQDAIQLFLPMISKCCVIEMHKQRIGEALSGETPEARFDDFIEQCKQQVMYQKLWSTYPVLATCIKNKAIQYEAAMLEFFEHLDADLPTIENTLLQQPLARLTKIKASGDTHRQCRRVLIVSGQSTSGTPVHFVYKPRSLSNERYFSDLCQWYNQTQSSPPLKTPTLITRKTYGYCEFINYETCQQDSEINEFYHSLGELTALLLLINGLDIHQENIIAHGKHPVLIDMECIMTPVLKANEHNYPNVGQSLILPRKTNINKKSKGVDISGLSDNDNQQSWRKVPCWHKPGTDEMHLVREEKKFKTQGNTPRIDTKKAAPIAHYQDEFMSGFKSAYQTVLNHRDHLLSEQSPLFQAEPITTRYLFRSTSDYAILLHESYHPLLLDDATKHAEHIDWINEILPYRPYYKNIVVAERADIVNDDIPYFESRADEKIIYDSRHKPVPIELIYSGEEQCRRMIHALSENHLETQCQLIKFSFMAHARVSLPRERFRDFRVPEINSLT
jgi:type 2 lantibiotic biosynthesis protein LanM